MKKLLARFQVPPDFADQPGFSNTRFTFHDHEGSVPIVDRLGQRQECLLIHRSPDQRKLVGRIHLKRTFAVREIRFGQIRCLVEGSPPDDFAGQLNRLRFGLQLQLFPQQSPAFLILLESGLFVA